MCNGIYVKWQHILFDIAQKLAAQKVVWGENISNVILLSAPTFPSMPTAQSGSVASKILIKLLPGWSRPIRSGVNLPWQRWDEHGEMTAWAGIWAELHPITDGLQLSARSNYVTAGVFSSEALLAAFIDFLNLQNGSGEMGAEVDPAVSFGCCGAPSETGLDFSACGNATSLRAGQWNMLQL